MLCLAAKNTADIVEANIIFHMITKGYHKILNPSCIFKCLHYIYAN